MLSACIQVLTYMDVHVARNVFQVIYNYFKNNNDWCHPKHIQLILFKYTPLKAFCFLFVT